MSGKRIFPLAVGAVVGGTAAYYVKTWRDRERSARLPMSRFDKELRFSGYCFRTDPLLQNITPKKLRAAGKLMGLIELSEFPGQPNADAPAPAGVPVPAQVQRSSRFAPLKVTYPDLRHSVHTVVGRSGSFPVHVFAPLEAEGPLPVMVWLHGGGFFMDTTSLELELIRQLMAAAPSVFVIPEYRLSDQAAAPAAADDCYDALIWAKENLSLIGGRADQIFVGGYGAGGNLACSLTLMARDWGKVNIAFQMPLCPMLDDRMATLSSRTNDAPWWNTDLNRKAWKLYLGEEDEARHPSKYTAPARETDFAGLPPAYSLVGDLDPLADEAIAYISQLRAAGVKAGLTVYPKCHHAFELLVPQAVVSQQAIAHLCTEFRHAVDVYFAGN